MNKHLEKRIGVILWSIAFPGFGQLINKRYVKAIIFIALEMIINVKGNMNTVIVQSFLFHMESAVGEAHYLWILFYPCIYLFAIWDAYYDAGGGEFPFMYIPFVLSAYLGTLGVVYSSTVKINGYLLGPIFLPIIAMVIGFLFGTAIRKIMAQRINHT